MRSFFITMILLQKQGAYVKVHFIDSSAKVRSTHYSFIPEGPREMEQEVPPFLLPKTSMQQIEVAEATHLFPVDIIIIITTIIASNISISSGNNTFQTFWHKCQHVSLTWHAPADKSTRIFCKLSLSTVYSTAQQYIYCRIRIVYIYTLFYFSKQKLTQFWYE